MKKIIASILTVLLLLSLLATSALAASLEQDTAQRINLERAARGIAALEISTVLGGKARVKAQDMAENGYFSHTSPTYGSPFTMMRTLGVSYRSAAENIAMGYTKADAVVAAWMASPSHRESLLSSRYSVLGVGYYNGYWAAWLIR